MCPADLSSLLFPEQAAAQVGSPFFIGIFPFNDVARLQGMYHMNFLVHCLTVYQIYFDCALASSAPGVVSTGK